MKRIIIFGLLLSCIFGSAQAQTNTVLGTVKDVEGDPLHFAFIQNKQEKHSTFTDSLGMFTIIASPNSVLRINCAGYKDTSINVGNKSNFIVVLRLNSVNITATRTATGESADTRSMKNTFNDDLTLQATRGTGAQFDASAGATIPVFQPKEETVGSRYFFKGWVHGYVVNAKDSLVQNAGFMFDYDKKGGGLLLTRDKVSAIEIDRDVVKSFTLFDNRNVAYTFERVPQIDNTHYVQVLGGGSKYKIYKAIKNNFIRSNFTTNGVSTSGNNYDEYVDEGTYYVYDVKNNALEKLSLKKKSLKEDFAKDADRLNKFMSEHSSDDIDDFYLSSLGSYMNE